MSTWALNSTMAWPSARQCARTTEFSFGNNEDCLVPEYAKPQNSIMATKKRCRLDSANALDTGGMQKVNPREELAQEWNLSITELDGLSTDELMSEALEGAFTSEQVSGRSAKSSKTTTSRSDLSNEIDFYMNDRDFFEEDADASVVTSSCHFSLTDVCPGIELLADRNSAQKELDGSLDAISNLDDMEDIFGHNGCPFGQADTGSSALQMRNDTCPSSQKPPPICSPDSEPKTLQNQNACSYFPSSNKRKDCSTPHDQRPVKESRSELSHENMVYWLGEKPTKQDQQSLLLSSVAHGLQPGFANAIQPLLGNIQQGKYGSQLPGPVIEQRQQQLQESMIPHAMQPRAQVKKESDSWIDGRTFAQASTTAPEQNSSMAGPEDEGFLDTAVLYQLGSTMCKLDTGTRLCIRNSLYRLAKNAAYRNGEESISAANINTRDAANQSSKSSRYGGLAPLERCTNPVDRAVASLLFCRQIPDEPQPSQDSTSACAPPQPEVRSSDSWVQQPAPASETAQSLPVVTVNASQAVFGNKLPLPAIHKFTGYSDYSSSAGTRRGATTHHSSSSGKHFNGVSQQNKPHVPVGG